MTLDTKALEAAERLRVAAHRQLRAAQDDGWDLSPLAEWVAFLEARIKSESQIREEERERCAVYLEGCAQGLESGWEDSTPPAENTASANVLRIHAAMLRNGNAS